MAEFRNCHLIVSLFICNAFPNFPADYQSWNWAAKVHLMLCSRDFPKYKTSFCQPQWKISNNIDLFKILCQDSWHCQKVIIHSSKVSICALCLNLILAILTLSILAWLPQFWSLVGLTLKSAEMPLTSIDKRRMNYHILQWITTHT